MTALRHGQPIDMEAVRAAVRQREAVARQVAAELDDINRAALIINQLQREALAPAKGWWRPGKRRARALRIDAVMTAFSVGCTKGQISEASGASLEQVTDARHFGAYNPSFDDDAIRDWSAILRDAVARGLNTQEVAQAQGVCRSMVRHTIARKGYRLVRRHCLPSLIVAPDGGKP